MITKSRYENGFNKDAATAKHCFHISNVITLSVAAMREAELQSRAFPSESLGTSYK